MRSVPVALRVLAVITVVMGLLALPAAAQVPPGLPGAPRADGDGPVISPANQGDKAVNSSTSQGLEVSGSVPTSAAITRAWYVGYGAAGAEVVRVKLPDSVLRPATPFGQYLYNDGGQLDGSLQLTCDFGPPGGGCPHPEVRAVVLEIRIDQVYGSTSLPVDYVRPDILRYDVTAPTRLRVTFTEAVEHPQGDLPSDYVVTDPEREVLQVQGPTDGDCAGVASARPDIEDTGCTRTLVLASALPEDARPSVDYEPDKTVDNQPIPGRTAHEDFASQRAFTVVDPQQAADLVRPAIPKLERVDGDPVGSGPVVGTERAPVVEVSNVTAGHLVSVVFDLPDGSTLTADPVDPRNAALVAPALPEDFEGLATLSTVAIDANGNRSDETAKTAPRADGSPREVGYLVDETAPSPLLATGDGPFVTVQFDEDVLGANRPAEWTLTTGGPVTEVSGSGRSRLVKGSSPANGKISYTPDTGAGDTYRDAAGNTVGSFSLDIISGRTVLVEGPVSATEGAPLGFVLRLASAQDDPITASFTTQDGTGLAGSDYDAASGSVTFQPGQTQKLVSVTTRADALDEDDETMVLRLTGVQGGETKSGLDRATGTIIDDDPLPSLSVQDVSANEGATARVTIALSAVSGRAVQVTLTTEDVSATSGEDYRRLDERITIPAGSTSATFPIAIFQDDEPDPDETFRVRLSQPSNATLARSTATVTIFDGAGVPAGGTRVSGASRTETSAAIAQAFWSAADTVVVATAEAYPDALAGAPLASSVNAPILLTGRSGLHPAVRDEVERLGATKAFVLGGAAALSSKVDDDLRAAGVRAVTRIAGKNRFETARLIAERIGGDAVYLVEGANADPNRGWPDAVAVSGLAAAQQRPILLTEKDRFPGETRGALRSLTPSRLDIVGGVQAVNEAVERAADQEAGTVRRIAGRTRFETSLAIAEASRAAGLDEGNTWVTTGGDWPDSLAASPGVARTGGVLLLVDSTDLDRSPPARTWVERHRPRSITIIGGLGAIAQRVADQLEAAAGR